MSNWDRLQIECENVDIIKGLVKGTHGIKGLWFEEADINPKDPSQCSMVARNDVNWIEALKELSRQHKSSLKCWVHFEIEFWSVGYHVVFQDGEDSLKDVRANYMWPEEYEYRMAYNENGNIACSKDGYTLYEYRPKHPLTESQKDEIVNWCRKVDDVEQQEKRLKETDGDGSIDYKDTVLNWFEFDNFKILIRKEWFFISVEDVKARLEANSAHFNLTEEKY